MNCENCNLVGCCSSRCPYADEPQAVFYCTGCGEPICVNDDYFKVGFDVYCKDCCIEATAGYDDIEQGGEIYD